MSKNTASSPADKIIKSQVASSEISFADFNNPAVGETFGGSYPALELEPNSVSKRLIYIKDSKIVLTKTVDGKEEAENKKIAVVAEKDAPEKLFGLPISAIFEKNWKEADLEIGSEFVVARFPDTKKKRGQGAGQTMKNYALKVLVRAKKAE